MNIKVKVRESINEASAFIGRDGEPTKLFSVVDYIMEGGNDAMIVDLQTIFPHISTLYVTLKNTKGILCYQKGSSSHYCVTKELYDQYAAASKEIGWDANPWAENPNAQQAKAPSPSAHREAPKPAPAPEPAPAAASAPKATAPATEPIPMKWVICKGWYNNEHSYDRDTANSSYCAEVQDTLKQKYPAIAADIKYETDEDSDDEIVVRYELKVPAVEADSVAQGFDRYKDNFDEYSGTTIHDADPATPANIAAMTEGEKLFLRHQNESSQTIKFFGISVYGSKHVRTYIPREDKYDLKPREIVAVSSSNLPTAIVRQLAEFRLTNTARYYKGIPIKVSSQVPRDASDIVTHGFVDYLSYYCGGYGMSQDIADLVQSIAQKYPSSFDIGQGGGWGNEDGGNFESFRIPNECKADYIKAFRSSKQ